ncbi:MAG: SDR family NAD(P)-dependent oxidoreductase [Acidimicrobiia bacterium]
MSSQSPDTSAATGSQILAGKVAIVTGAGSGIGRATALRFAREGAAVMVSEISVRRGQETVDMITAAGGRAISMKVDVSKPEDIEAMVAKTVDEFGQLDILINNAATVRPGGAIELAVEDWDIVWKTNVSSVFLGAKYAAPQMKNGGAIVSVASTSGLMGDTHLISYNATKAAVINLTRALAIDLTPLGIRVNCICPGITMTPAQDAFMSEPVMRSLSELTTPMRRNAQPEEMAAAMLWLASPESSYVSGHALVVDGGLTAQQPFALLLQVRDHLADGNVDGV